MENSNNTVSAKAIESQLQTDFIAKKIFAFSKLASTNELAKRLAKNERNEGTLVIAEEQTRGRGRLQRCWHSPPNSGLWFTVILSPKQDIEKIGMIPLLTGVAVAQALEKLNLWPALKWPNDVLLNSKKVCGILAETEFSAWKLSSLVVGIGINVNQKKNDFPLQLKNNVTSLQIETKNDIDRIKLLAKILYNLEQLYSKFKDGKTQFILDEWKKRCPFIDQTITVQQEGVSLEGIFEDLHTTGALLLRTNGNGNGNVKTITAGELTIKGFEEECS